MKAKHQIALLLVILGICGCEEVTSSAPQMPPAIPGTTLLTPQPDGWSELEAKMDYEYNTVYYIVGNWIGVQGFDSEIRSGWIGTTPGNTISQLKLYPDYLSAVYVFNGSRLTRAGNGDIILSNYGVQGVYPRISPDGNWVAFIGFYGGFLTISNVYIVNNQGEIFGELHQVTFFEDDSYSETSVRPVCWLSDHELVVRKKHLSSGSSDSNWQYDMLKYDINNLIAPPQVLTTSYGSEYQPMGYDEVVYVPGSFYITNCGDASFRFANLYKCPLGVAGDYGQQLTFGGNFDIPCDLSPDGTKLLFIRFYRDGSNYLTGESDIYLMDLDSLVLEKVIAKATNSQR
jgi:hypothetical protein